MRNYCYEPRVGLGISYRDTHRWLFFWLLWAHLWPNWKGRFHYRYLYIQLTPNGRLWPLWKGSGSTEESETVVLNTTSSYHASFLTPGRSEELPNPQFATSRFHSQTAIPETFPWVGIPTNWLYPSVLDLLKVFSSSSPTPAPSYLSPRQTNNRLDRNTDWILGVSTSDNNAQVIYWSLQFHLRVVNVLLSVIPSSSPPRSSRWGAASFTFIPVAFGHKDKHLNVTARVRELLVGVALRREGYPGPLASIPKAHPSPTLPFHKPLPLHPPLKAWSHKWKWTWPWLWLVWSEF